MSVETVLETIVVSEVLREAGAPETVIEQLVRTEVVVETSGRPGNPGVSVVNVVAAQASDGTVTLNFTMSDGETHVVTFKAGVGELPAQLDLAGHAVARGSAAAALAAALDLSGVAAASARATAPIAAELALAGAAAGRATAAGGLVASLALNGTAAGRASAAGQASIALDLAGSAVGRAHASATLTIGDELALRGTAIGRSAATAAAILELTITGTTAGRAAASGALAAVLDLTGRAAGIGASSAVLTASTALAGAATGRGAASGAVTLQAGSSYDPDAVAAFNAMTLQPSAARATLLNDFIAGGRSDGWWQKIIGWQMYAAHDAQAGRVDLKLPSRIASTLSSPVFVLDRGYLGDGAGAGLDTGIVDDPAFQDNVSFGAYANAGTSGRLLWWNSNANRLTANSDTRVRTTVGAVFGGFPNTLGLWAGDRDAVNSLTAYRNGVATNNRVGTSSSPTAVSLLTHRISSGAFGDDRIAAVFAGRSMTATDHANLYARLNTFLTAIGAA